MLQQFNAMYERDGDWWVASAITVRGAFSQGRTLEEARKNLRDAVRQLLLAKDEVVDADAGTSAEGHNFNTQ